MRRTVLPVLACLIVVGVAAAGVPVVARQQMAAARGINAITYSDRTTFESTLGNFITDDYSAPGYLVGDITTGDITIHSDAHMSAVLGETIYQTTFNANYNVVYRQSETNWIYCSGCNGSALLKFTSTSVSRKGGVYGVGFDYLENFYPVSPSPTHAFVTFGDGTTADYELSSNQQSAALFWGITSPKLIISVHLGGAGGAATSEVYWKIDNLTIGSRGR